MNIKTANDPASSNPPRKIYQPPRLVTFGKLSAIVTGGSSGTLEGMRMTSQTRRA